MVKEVKEKVDDLFALLNTYILEDKNNKSLWTSMKIELEVGILEMLGKTIENVKITKMKIDELKGKK